VVNNSPSPKVLVFFYYLYSSAGKYTVLVVIVRLSSTDEFSRNSKFKFFILQVHPVGPGVGGGECLRRRKIERQKGKTC
jgi:hypothetical protein